MAFLEDYDMRVGRHLVQGVDVWVNTPRRPWEASGTSGMKVLANGGLNLSQFDGWWAEACTGEVGWGIGDGAEHDESYDVIDADQLYSLLEEQVVPAFYQRNDAGIPEQWVKRMRASMGNLVTQFSADRAVRDYTEQYYLPAAQAYRARSAQGGRLAAELNNIRQQLQAHRAAVRFVDMQMSRRNGHYSVELLVDLAGIPAVYLRVQLYREGDGMTAARIWDLRLGSAMQADGAIGYRGEVPDDCPEQAYTARVIADASSGLNVPLEERFIVWQK